MNTRHADRRSLHALIAPATTDTRRFIADPHIRVRLCELAGASLLGSAAGRLRGRSVMIAARRQLAAALAAIELDGVARRLVLCTPDLAAADRIAACLDAQIDAVVTDDPDDVGDLARHADVFTCQERLAPAELPADRGIDTEWVLFTSGTTGRPKLAVHTLRSLIAPFAGSSASAAPTWSSFYDIRRYGGLQILLRALVGGGSMVLSEPGEPIARFLARAGTASVSHISGTPSHWRGVLMSAAEGSLSPGVVRLSGEACDQAILDRLQQAFPRASIGHAFASTEAGVGFEVNDGAAGFPASLIEQAASDVWMSVADGSLRIRSPRTAARYLGADAPALHDRSGLVDTGDLVERHGARYRFVGRRGGIINVGGRKVHPEAVEAVINRHPDVHMSRVSSRPNPITGALVMAEIVLRADRIRAGTGFEATRDEILTLCRELLPAWQVPAMLRPTASLDVAASGKLVRTHA